VALVLLPLAASVTTTMAIAVTGATGAGEPTSRVTVGAERHVRVGETVKINGRVEPGAQRTVQIHIGGDTETVRTTADGSFNAEWRSQRPGRYQVAAVVTGGVSAPSGRMRKKVNVYRPAEASYYGPGLYGGHLACGGTLGPGTVGVANKSLPCGAKLTLRYGNRSVRVKVIDRGPYSGNREFDLTAATKRKLGFPSTGTVLTTR
jgi:rare lipoprotein A (peptidoglycan hydrolase)